MIKKKYEKKCKKLFEKAQKYGLVLKFKPQAFDHRRLNCLWYGGDLATIRITDTLDIELNVYGDVYARLFDKHDNELAYVKDKGNNGRFADEMNQFIKNDRKLKAVLNSGRLQLDYNNWIEYDGVIHSGDSHAIGGQFIDLGLIYDNILDDNILTAIDSALEGYKEIVKEIMWVAKG